MVVMISGGDRRVGKWYCRLRSQPPETTKPLLIVKCYRRLPLTVRSFSTLVWLTRENILTVKRFSPLAAAS